MNITEVGHRADGSLLGEDEDGNLYRGIKRQAGHEEIVRDIEETADGYIVRLSIGGQQIGKATLAKSAFDPNDDWKAEPVKYTATVIEDGVERQETRERKITVVDWESI